MVYNSDGKTMATNGLRSMWLVKFVVMPTCQVRCPKLEKIAGINIKVVVKDVIIISAQCLWNANVGRSKC